MGQFIVRFDVDGQPMYLNWSTIVDAPITYGMTLPELEEYVKERWGTEGLKELPARIARADSERRSSSLERGYTKESLVRNNGAGPGESCMTEEEIIEWYCRKQTEPPPDVGHCHTYDDDEGDSDTCEEAIAKKESVTP